MSDTPAATQLGKYAVRGTLGRGAMGTVYDGWDPAIDRRVAIKTVRMPEAHDAEAQEGLARFKREAQAAGRLTHPNIVGVFDYGETSDVAYIVMEFVEGQTLKELLDRAERLPLHETVRLMQDVLAGLAYSHERGVVHRDIKPANIMITKDNRAKIADFGIARIESSSMTQAGTVLGTPAYMSPEQFMGQTVDKRTDIYSSGVLLYQLLTGERPFEGSLTSIMHKALNTTPPRPSELSVSVPAGMDAVVGKAMARRPDDRFEGAGAFTQALSAALQAPVAAEDPDATVVNAPKRAAPPPPPPPKPAPVPKASPRRSVVPMAAGAVALLLVAGGAGWFLLSPGPQKLSPDRVVVATGQAPDTAPPVKSVEPNSTLGTTPGVKPAEPNPTLGTTPAVKPAEPNPQLGATPGVKPAEPATLGLVQPPSTEPERTTLISPGNSLITSTTSPLVSTPAPVRSAAAVTAALAASLPGVDCTLAQAVVGAGAAVEVTGIAGAGAPLAALKQAAEAASPGAATTRADSFDGPYCKVLDAVRPQLDPFGNKLAASLPDRQGALKDNAVIPLTVTMPGFAGYLQVAYLANDGTVAVMVPGTGYPARSYSAGAKVELGTPRDGFAGWHVGPPFGTDMIMVVASSAPLVMGKLPDALTVAAYAQAVQAATEALRRRGGSLAARALVLETRAGP